MMYDIIKSQTEIKIGAWVFDLNEMASLHGNLEFCYVTKLKCWFQMNLLISNVHSILLGIWLQSRRFGRSGRVGSWGVWCSAKNESRINWDNDGCQGELLWNLTVKVLFDTCNLMVNFL